MMRQVWLAAGLMAGLGACTSTDVADSAATGVGFGDYETYLAERQAREAQLRGAAPSAPVSSGAPEATPAPVAGITAADLAAAGIGVANTAGRRPAPPAAPAAPMETVAGTAGATGAGTAPTPGAAPVIERAGPQVTASAAPPAPSPVVAAPVPEAVGTDIVAYALATRHAVGQQVYRRTFASPGRSARACNRYAGADLAQRAFLEAGGPERDRLGLDPDGDGFACGWDPEPFRAARG